MTPDTSGAPLHSKKETTFSWGCVRSSGRCRSGGVLRSARACNSFILGVWRKPLDGRDQVLARCLLPMLWMNLEEGIYCMHIIYIYIHKESARVPRVFPRCVNISNLPRSEGSRPALLRFSEMKSLSREWRRWCTTGLFPADYHGTRKMTDHQAQIGAVGNEEAR